MTDSERDRALARDLAARARLAGDPVAQIIASRDDPGDRPRFLFETDKSVLTGREAEVLAYLSRGLNNQMVADAMFLSLETIKSHMKRARAKLRAKNATQACCEAIRRGLIP